MHMNKFKISLMIIAAGLFSLAGMVSRQTVTGKSFEDSQTLPATPTPAGKVKSPALNNELKTENVPVNWIIRDEKTPLKFEDLIKPISPEETLTSKKVNVRTEGGSEPRSVLIIYKPDGSVLICIGSEKDCAAATK